MDYSIAVFPKFSLDSCQLIKILQFSLALFMFEFVLWFLLSGLGLVLRVVWAYFLDLFLWVTWLVSRPSLSPIGSESANPHVDLIGQAFHKELRHLLFFWFRLVCYSDLFKPGSDVPRLNYFLIGVCVRITGTLVFWIWIGEELSLLVPWHFVKQDFNNNYLFWKTFSS